MWVRIEINAYLCTRKPKKDTTMARKKGLEVAIPTQNKDVTTTWSFVFGRHPDMSVDEQRVIARILEVAGEDLEGKLMKNELQNFQRSEWGDVRMQLNVKDFMVSAEGWKHEDVKNMLDRLSKRSFTYEDEKVWTSATYISSPLYEKGTGKVHFTVPKLMWWAMRQFAGGYRKFEINKALALPTTYSFRLYLLMSGQKVPFDMSIPTFFKWMGIPLDEYVTTKKDPKTGKEVHKINPAPYRDKNGKFRIDHIDDRVLKPAQSTLDGICPWSFRYEKIRENPDKKTSKVIGFRFFPTYIDKNRDPKLAKLELEHKVGTGMIDKAVKSFLVHTCGYTITELNRTREVWLECQELIDYQTMSEAWAKSRGADNPKAYFVSKIRGKIEDIKKRPKNVWQPKDTQ